MVEAIVKELIGRHQPTGRVDLNDIAEVNHEVADGMPDHGAFVASLPASSAAQQADPEGAEAFDLATIHR